jgi:hypothetical protein
MMLTGRFGRLTVIKRDRRERRDPHAYWRCRCDCGREAIVQGSKLRTGWTRSCGCLLRENGRRRLDREI